MYMNVHDVGWNSGTPKEIFSPTELIDAFDLSRIIKSPSMFDFEKLRWVSVYECMHVFKFIL